MINLGNGFMSVLNLLGDLFKNLFDKLDHFYILGRFSIIDFCIAVLAIDIVITALFVTFNASVGGQYDFRSQEAREKAIADRQTRIARYRYRK